MFLRQSENQTCLVGDGILLTTPWLQAVCTELAIQAARSGTRIARTGKCRDDAAQENHHAQRSFRSERTFNGERPGS